jgi:hypothetical protein
MTSLLMDVLFFLGRFEIVGYSIENKSMNTETGKTTHTLTIELKGGDSNDK